MTNLVPVSVAAFASFLKDILTVFICMVGLGFVIYLIVRPLHRYYTTKVTDFHFHPFLVAPEMEAKLGSVITAALDMEYKRAKNLLDQWTLTTNMRPTTKVGKDLVIRTVTAGQDSPVVAGRSNQAFRGNAYDTVRGQQNVKVRVARSRIEMAGVKDIEAFSHQLGVVEITPLEGEDALIVEAAGVKIVVFKLLRLLTNYLPLHYRQKVTGHATCIENELRVVVAVGPERSDWLRFWPSRTYQYFAALLSRFHFWRPVAADGSQTGAGNEVPAISSKSQRSAAPAVHECTAKLATGLEEVMDKGRIPVAAARIGSELAYKLLALRRYVPWEALKHFVNAVAAYNAGKDNAVPESLHLAIEFGKKVHEIRPDFVGLPDLMIAVADALLDLQDMDAAQQALLVVAARAADWNNNAGDERRRVERIRTAVRLGAIWYQTGLSEQAIAALEQARELSEKEDYKRDTVLPNLAAALALSGDPARARGIIFELTNYNENSEDLAAIRNTADHLAKIDLYTEALKVYQKLIKLDDRSNYVKWRCGIMCAYLAALDAETEGGNSKVGRYEEAKSYFEDASSGAREQKISAKAHRGNPQAGAGDPDDAWHGIDALNDLGLVLLETGNLDEARKCFVDALSAAPREWDIWNNLAYAEQKLVEIDCANSQSPTNVYAHIKKLYSRTIALAPTKALPRINLAYLLEREGAHEAALTHFTSAKSLAAARRGAAASADVTACVQGQARVLERMGEFKKAAETIEARLVSDRNNATLELHLALLLFKQDVLSRAEVRDQALTRVWRSRAIAADPQSNANVQEVTQLADEIEGYIYRCSGMPGLAKIYFDRRAATSEYARASLAFLSYKNEAEHSRQLVQCAWVDNESRALYQQHSVANEDAYYRACIAALVGATEDALELLKQALAWQPAIRRWARVDPDFELISNDPCFAELVGPAISA